jgi:hypothetical protein
MRPNSRWKRITDFFKRVWWGLTFAEQRRKVTHVGIDG